MPFVPKLSHLRAMSDDELERKYDEQTGNVPNNLEYYRNEIIRREIEGRELRMLQLTKIITWLTIVVSISTVLNLIATTAIVLGS